MIVTALTAGAVAGLASVPHCAGMCGPLAAFACRGARATAPVRYQIGRTVGYALLGAVAGSVGEWVAAGLSGRWVPALLSWAMALALGLAAIRLWRSGGQPREASGQLVPLRRDASRRGRLGRLVDRAVQLLPRDPLAIGLLTGLLPCGALAAAVLIAAGTGSALAGAVVMVAFATTSSLGLLGAGWLAAWMRRRGAIAGRLLAVGLALGAVVLAVRPVQALRAPEGEAPCCHGAANEHAEANEQTAPVK